MAVDARPTPQTLFKQWRNGDAAAGQAMAQRFTDWYYAVSTARLGDAHGRQPMQRACQRFQQGIVSVTDASRLADWAHGLIAEEIASAGGRITGGDFPNALTQKRSPTEILARAAVALPRAQVDLLGAAYDPTVSIEVLEQKAEALGGMPVAVLEARHALKQWLKNSGGVGLGDIPEKPNLDCAPLPVYESGRMTNAVEEAGFEKWLLTDLALCRDVAEFAAFAMALRGGAFRSALAPASSRTDKHATTRLPTEVADAVEGKSGGNTMMIVGGVIFVLLAVAAGAAAVFLVGG
jgi:hypothetical protein